MRIRCSEIHRKSVLSGITHLRKFRNNHIANGIRFNVDSIKSVLKHIRLNTTQCRRLSTDNMRFWFTDSFSCKCQTTLLILAKERNSVERLYRIPKLYQRHHSKTKSSLNNTALINIFIWLIVFEILAFIFNVS